MYDKEIRKLSPHGHPDNYIRVSAHRRSADPDARPDETDGFVLLDPKFSRRFGAHHWLSPKRARELAKMLVDAADYVERR